MTKREAELILLRRHIKRLGLTTKDLVELTEGINPSETPFTDMQNAVRIGSDILVHTENLGGCKNGG